MARELVHAAFGISTGDNATALVIDVVTLPPPDIAELSSAFAINPILPMPRLGAKVDGFHLMELLSEGRYSSVFKAHDDLANRAVVVKFPKPNITTEAIFRQTFMRETWIAAKVRSPFIGETIENSGRTEERRLYRHALLRWRNAGEPAVPAAVDLILDRS